MTPRSLAELLLNAVAKPRPDCLLYRVGGTTTALSTADLAGRVEHLATALLKKGVKPGDRIALLAENGPDWAIVELTSLAVGAVLVPLYPSLPVESAVRGIHASHASWLFAQGRDRVEAVKARRGELPELRHLIALDSEPDDGDDGGDTLETLLQAGASNATRGDLERSLRQRQPSDPATLLYSSDPRRESRGVMLTQGELASRVIALAEALPIGAEHTAMVTLPLPTLVARTLHDLTLFRGAAVAYPESTATLDHDLAEIRPHVFAAVPAFFKRLMNRIYGRVQQGSEEQQAAFRRAVAAGREALPYRLEGTLPPGDAGAELAEADRTIFREIRQLLGGRTELALSLGRPLSEGWMSFLWAAGIPVFEGYCPGARSPLLATNAPGAVELGTVGRPIVGLPLPGIEASFSDVGELDAEGYLTLTSDDQDCSRLEALLEASHFIRHAMVVEQSGKPPVALVAPDFDRLDVAAKAHGVQFNNRQELLRDPRVQGLFAGEIGNINQGLDAETRVSSWELLADELSFAAGELTPFGTIRRSVLQNTHGKTIARLMQHQASPTH